jgi:hypothetical protein
MPFPHHSKLPKSKKNDISIQSNLDRGVNQSVGRPTVSQEIQYQNNLYLKDQTDYSVQKYENLEF